MTADRLAGSEVHEAGVFATERYAPYTCQPCKEEAQK